MKCTMSRSLWILIASVISKDVLPHFTHFDIAMNHVLSVANVSDLRTREPKANEGSECRLVGNSLCLFVRVRHYADLALT